MELPPQERFHSINTAHERKGGCHHRLRGIALCYSILRMDAIPAAGARREGHLAPQPNILLILTDQQRFDTIAAHTNAFNVRTPGIDALCRRSVVFENAFCTAPICGPSRA